MRRLPQAQRLLSEVLLTPMAAWSRRRARPRPAIIVRRARALLHSSREGYRAGMRAAGARRRHRANDRGIPEPHRRNRAHRVTHQGTVCGVERDYLTPRDRDRGRFERFIIGLVRSRIGGGACPLVHVTFHRDQEQDICRVIVEPADRPVYFHNSGVSHLFVRTGNSTRELDVREAKEHATRRFAARSSKGGAGLSGAHRTAP